VGFRYTTKNIAMRFDVSGYVRNLPDGRVELIVEGPPPQIEEMIRSVESRMSGYIQQIENSILPATGEFSHFHIRH
jgi:acylphosphatase